MYVLEWKSMEEHVIACDVQRVVFCKHFQRRVQQSDHRQPGARVGEGELGWGNCSGQCEACMHAKPVWKHLKSSLIVMQGQVATYGVN